MKTLTYILLDMDDPADREIRDKIRMIGVREVARRTNLSPTMISMFSMGRVRMLSENFDQVVAALGQRIY